LLSKSCTYIFSLKAHPSYAILAASSARQSSQAHHRLHRSGRLRRLRPSLPRLAHTRSDQPTCVIHPAPMTSVLVVRVYSPSMEGCCYVASSDRSGTTRGLVRRCIFTAPDHVHDLVVNFASMRPTRMVFIKLFELFVVSFKHRRRVIRNIQPYTRQSSFTSSLRLAQPHRQHRCRLPAYFVYSSNSRIRQHLLPRRSSAPATTVEAFSAGPSEDNVWLCTLPYMSSIGNTGAWP